MPATLEGMVAWTVLCTGAGQWKRAGMTGAPAGLDLAACLSRREVIESGADAGAVEDLLVMAEGAAIEAMAEAAKETGED